MIPGHVWSPSVPGRVACEACSEAMALDAVEEHALSTRHEINVKNLYTAQPSPVVLVHIEGDMVASFSVPDGRDEAQRVAAAIREALRAANITNVGEPMNLTVSYVELHLGNGGAFPDEGKAAMTRLETQKAEAAQQARDREVVAGLQARITALGLAAECKYYKAGEPPMSLPAATVEALLKGYHVIPVGGAS